MGIESLTIAAQAAGFSMVARDDTELGELRNRETERGTTMIVSKPAEAPRRRFWQYWFRPKQA